MDWIDIVVHAAIAALWAAFAGWVAGFGLGIPGMPGAAMAALGLALGLACLAFWPLRERRQHGGWGGPQSQLEWIVPDIIAVPGFAAGFLLT